ncbi:MAG: hypothetical protein KAI16_02950 [Candidatus Pacebacteria bacterium]|nr:hypothetical protein [Candidatus Paceibacterota bacterium]
MALFGVLIQDYKLINNKIMEQVGYVDQIGEKLVTFVGSLQEVYRSFLGDIALYAWKAFLAVIFLIIGWYVVRVVQETVEQIMGKLNLDKILKKFQIDEMVRKTGHELNSAVFVGVVVKWVLLAGFFIGALQILGLYEVIDLAVILLGVVGNIMVALGIFALAVLTSRFVASITGGVSNMLNIKSSKLLTKTASGLIYFTALITVLGLFSVADPVSELIMGVLQGVVFGFALAFGLAFGLGGKEKAKEIMDKIDR